MRLLQLDQLTDFAVESVSPFFENLPETDHKDGKYRLRKYSLVELLMEPKMFKVLEAKTFTQSKDYNNFQGDVERKFENLDDELLQSSGFKEILYLFRMINQLPHGTNVDIHQMRIVVTDGKSSMVSPEGIHQDGYDCIAMIGISRYNITGGHLLVYNNSDDEFKGKPLPETKPFFDLALDAGKIVFVNDKNLWHNASSISPVDPSEHAYMDSFILTANR